LGSGRPDLTALIAGDAIDTRYQGPHIYAIYKYEKDLPEKLVAALYAAGFIAGAASASFAGELADRFGRRLACLIYCLSYVVTCMTMLYDNITILFIGRIFGGVATTLLYSVFEAWLVTEYHSRELERSHLKLSDIFGSMTTLSSVVAIASGIIGEALVDYFGGARIWPFMAGALSATVAALLILKLWPENYGVISANSGDDSGSTSSLASNMSKGLRSVLSDRKVWGLGLTQTFFEGTMYLFVFFWSAALKSARQRSGSEEQLPFGIIFSSFMCAMMAGSAFFSLGVAKHTKESTSVVLMLVVLTVSCCLSAAVLIDDERVLFWVLCMVELCIGAYFPSMSYLKSQVVEDGVRGRVYSVLRLPLNLFVVVAHSLDQEGDAHRNHVFMICAGLLMVSFFVVKRSFAS
jgi:MFS family permease